jgi:hypothetical protein
MPVRSGVALIAALTAVAGLCGACSSGDADPAASPSPLTFGPPSFPATASPTPADPYAIPDTIDAAYIEKVYGALADVEAEALQLLIDERGTGDVLPPAIRDRLRAILSPDRFPTVAARWQRDFVTDDELGLRDVIRPVRIDVQEIVHAVPTCVVALAAFDVSGTAATPPPTPPAQYVALVPADPSRDPDGYNPTPWTVAFELLPQSGTPNEVDPCHA